MEPEWSNGALSPLEVKWSRKIPIVLWLFMQIIKNPSKIIAYLTEKRYVNGMVLIPNSFEEQPKELNCFIES